MFKKLPPYFTRLPPIQLRLYARGKTPSSQNGDIKLHQMSSQLSKNLTSIELLTNKVQRAIQKKKIELDSKSVKEELGKPDEEISPIIEEDVEEIFESINFKDGTNSANTARPISTAINLFPKPKPFVNLPENITSSLSTTTLGLVSSPETAQWAPLLKELIHKSASDNFSLNARVDLTPGDFHSIVKSIPKTQRGEVVDLLHELAYTSGVVYNENNGSKTLVMNDLLALCHYLKPEQADIVVQKILEDVNTDLLPGNQPQSEGGALSLSSDQQKIVPDVPMKTILINHYARLKDINKVKSYIDDFNTLPSHLNPLKRSPVIYTNIMQMYIRLNQYRLARDTFDTMRFLSMATSPSSRSYTSMILMDTLNNDIEHGLEVYETMLSSNIKPEPDALLALAKGCAMRSNRVMVQKGWKFIIDYYNNGYDINERVMEIMMYLAYMDGDLPFVRAIWITVCNQEARKIGRNATSIGNSKMVKWLFNTYYKMGDIMKQEQERFNEAQRCGAEYIGWKPLGVINDNVASIRNKVIEACDFQYMINGPPLLPQKEFIGVDPKLVLLEAKAIWRFLLVENPQVINEKIYESYLYVLGRYGSIREFKELWNKSSVLGYKKEGAVQVEVEEMKNEDKYENNTDSNKVEKKAVAEKWPLPLFERNDRLYNMCLHVSRHQGDLDFAQKIWEERGQYRLSEPFQELNIAEQNIKDFKFARLMLSLFVGMGQLEDGFKLVLSSKKRFLWQYYHLKSLLVLSERMGDVHMKRELMKIVKRGNQLANKNSKR